MNDDGSIPLQVLSTVTQSGNNLLLQILLIVILTALNAFFASAEIALLSVNLAVINLLPLPVLDGGYLLILIIEGITRRKLQGRGMEIAIMVGWLLILGLFILTMWNDLARVFGWN